MVNGMKPLCMLMVLAGMCCAVDNCRTAAGHRNDHPVVMPLEHRGGAAAEAALSAPLKSKGRAFLYSLLLPGMGERYAGAPRRSEVFLGTEIGLWLGYGAFLKYGDWRTEEYENFSAAHADVDPAGKSFTYYVNIGNYHDIDEYNAAKLRQRDATQYYYDLPAYYWNWDADANRLRFDRIRKSAARADRNATLVLGAIFANHLVSAIDAVWVVNSHNRALSRGFDWQIQFGDGWLQPRVQLAVMKRF
jgi:hypothetical protein